MASAQPGRDTLRTFYDTTLLPDLRALETERVGVVRSIRVEGAIAGGVVCGGLLLMAAGVHPVVPIIVMVVAIAAWVIRWVSRAQDYTAAFKARIIGKLVTFLDPHLTYEPDNLISREWFESSGLYSQKADIYEGQDLVTGTIGATKIAFSEVHAQYETTSTDSKGNTTTHRHTILKGILFVADFNKSFRGRTFVLPDVAQSLLGKIGQALQSWNPSRADLIKLEDPDFERAFVVYGDDQVEARYILTPGLMHRILDYRVRTECDLRCSFVNSQMFVALPQSQNLFEPKLFRTILDFAMVQDYLRHLELAAGMVEEFNLNTRIWGKA